MTPGGRLSAVIEAYTDFNARRVPAKTALQDWGRAHRFAGSKDRAWISGLLLDMLRHKTSLEWRMGSDDALALGAGALVHVWGWTVAQVAEAAEMNFGPGPLSAALLEKLEAPRPLDDAPAHVRGDYPDWLDDAMARVFGDRRGEEGAALAMRAPVDVRVNALKADEEKVLDALGPLGAAPAPYLANALRIAPPSSDRREQALTGLPAFLQGWIEVQDLGSQVAAAAAGDVTGAQVLDYCAGGGGKALAIAAAMGNSGQVYAYDADARRLSAINERLQRAGVRNVQVRVPGGGGGLDDLKDRMDVVFIDAPCTGSGVWRRHPDSKWRVTPHQLKARLTEQDAVLDQAAAFVKPGGRLVYVTCSLFAEENEDRLAAFMNRRADFSQTGVLDALAASGRLRDGASDALKAFEAAGGALRLTPAGARTDGFFVATLVRSS